MDNSLMSAFSDSDVLMVEALERKRESLESGCKQFGSSLSRCVTRSKKAKSNQDPILGDRQSGSSVSEESSVDRRQDSEKTTLKLEDLPRLTTGRLLEVGRARICA